MCGVYYMEMLRLVDLFAYYFFNIIYCQIGLHTTPNAHPNQVPSSVLVFHVKHYCRHQSLPLILFFFMFIYFWRRDREQAGEGQRERETQNLNQAPGSELSVQSLMQGSNSQAVRSWPEPMSDAQATEPPRRPPPIRISENVHPLEKYHLVKLV